MWLWYPRHWNFFFLLVWCSYGDQLYLFVTDKWIRKGHSWYIIPCKPCWSLYITSRSLRTSTALRSIFGLGLVKNLGPTRTSSAFRYAITLSLYLFFGRSIPHGPLDLIWIAWSGALDSSILIRRPAHLNLFTLTVATTIASATSPHWCSLNFTVIL